MGLIPGLGRPPGGGHGNLLQYSCLENLIDRGAWWATVYTVTKNWTWLNVLPYMYYLICEAVYNIQLYKVDFDKLITFYKIYSNSLKQMCTVNETTVKVKQNPNKR